MDTASPQAEGSVANLSNNAPSSYPQREGIWPNGPVQLARGRQAKDPNAKTVEYTVNSLDDFEESLREYLNGPPEDPEHTECHIYFWVGASFLVHYRPPGQQQQSQQQTQQQQQQSHQQPPSNHAPHSIPAHNAPPGYQPAEALDSQYGSHAPHSYHALNEPSLDLTLPYHAPPANPAQPPTPVEPLKANQKPEKIPMSIIEALTPTSEPKERMHKQRSIAKACVDAIQRVDGFRYSFHNTWASREDDSWRFSYYCNDSLLNKDRAANGKGAKMGKRATKSVWDCKGVLRVLFSATKQTVHVTYKHMPVHKTYAERAPPPRRDSKRRREQLNNPEGLAQIGDRSRSMSSSARPAIDLTGSAEPASASRTKTKKRKPTAEPKNATTSIENDLRNNSLRSLLELALPPEIVVPDQTQQSPAQAQAPGQIANNAVPGVEAASQPARQNPVQTQPARRRPRNSCDVCNRKKTRCDAARPYCSTCIEKGRECSYSEPQYAPLVETARQSSAVTQQQATPHAETIRQAQAASSELSEIEKMKKELEEAKARIQQLEAEKLKPPATTTPQRTTTPRTNSSSQQPRPRPQSRTSHQPQLQINTQTQAHVPAQTQMPTQSHPPPQHQPQPQRSPQPPTQQPQRPPSQQQQQQQHLQTTPQYSHTHTHNPYNAHATYGLNNTVDFPTQNTPPAPQPQAPHPLQQASRTGIALTAQDPSTAYNREFPSWSGIPNGLPNFYSYAGGHAAGQQGGAAQGAQGQGVQRGTQQSDWSVGGAWGRGA